MKALNITADNFSLVRETLKSGESCLVNNLVTLVSFKANTEYINEKGTKTRTPFKYVSECGKEYTSTQLKAVLNIEAETKGERKETTFATIWAQGEKLAEAASIEELKEAVNTLQEIIKRKEEEEAKKEHAKKEEAAKLLGFSSFEAFQKAQKRSKK